MTRRAKFTEKVHLGNLCFWIDPISFWTNYPVTILQSLVALAPFYWCVLHFHFLSAFLFVASQTLKKCAALLYRRGPQYCKHRTHGARQRGNDFLSQAAKSTYTTARRSIFNKESVVQKQSASGEGGLFVYVRAHKCLMSACWENKKKT